MIGIISLDGASTAAVDPRLRHRMEASPNLDLLNRCRAFGAVKTVHLPQRENGLAFTHVVIGAHGVEVLAAMVVSRRAAGRMKLFRREYQSVTQSMHIGNQRLLGRMSSWSKDRGTMRETHEQRTCPYRRR